MVKTKCGGSFNIIVEAERGYLTSGYIIAMQAAETPYPRVVTDHGVHYLNHSSIFTYVMNVFWFFA